MAQWFPTGCLVYIFAIKINSKSLLLIHRFNEQVTVYTAYKWSGHVVTLLTSQASIENGQRSDVWVTVCALHMGDGALHVANANECVT